MHLLKANQARKQMHRKALAKPKNHLQVSLQQYQLCCILLAFLTQIKPLAFVYYVHKEHQVFCTQKVHQRKARRNHKVNELQSAGSV